MNETDGGKLISTIDHLNLQLQQLQEVLIELKQNQISPIGDWIDEHAARKLTGLSTSTLRRLRVAGKIKSSFLSDRNIYYKLSDFKKLLDKNQRLR